MSDNQNSGFLTLAVNQPDYRLSVAEASAFITSIIAKHTEYVQAQMTQMELSNHQHKLRILQQQAFSEPQATSGFFERAAAAYAATDKEQGVEVPEEMRPGFFERTRAHFEAMDRATDEGKRQLIERLAQLNRELSTPPAVEPPRVIDVSPQPDEEEGGLLDDVGGFFDDLFALPDGRSKEYMKGFFGID